MQIKLYSLHVRYKTSDLADGTIAILPLTPSTKRQNIHYVDPEPWRTSHADATRLQSWQKNIKRNLAYTVVITIFLRHYTKEQTANVRSTTHKEATVVSTTPVSYTHLSLLIALPIKEVFSKTPFYNSYTYLSVSYTHLDVYKRQIKERPNSTHKTLELWTPEQMHLTQHWSTEEARNRQDGRKAFPVPDKQTYLTSTRSTPKSIAEIEQRYGKFLIEITQMCIRDRNRV